MHRGDGRGQSPRRVSWPVVILLSAMSAIGPLSIDLYLPSLPSIASALATSATAVQATVAVFFAGMAVGQLFYGPASDRFGRRKPLLFGLAIYVMGSGACAGAIGIRALLLGRAAQAVGACATPLIARAIVRDHFDYQQSARFLSLMALIAGAAPILAPSAGALLLPVLGWRGIFAILALFGLLLGATIFALLPESRTEAAARHSRSEHPFKAYAALLRERRLMGYVAAGAFNGAIVFTYIAASPSVLMQTYGAAPRQFGLLFGLNAIGIIGASQLNRMLLRKFSADAVLAAATLISVVVAAGLLSANVARVGGLAAVMAPLFLLVSSGALIQANALAGALSIDPLRAGSCAALFGSFSFGAGALAAMLAGALSDGTARPMALVILVSTLGCAVSLRKLALRRSSVLADG